MKNLIIILLLTSTVFINSSFAGNKAAKVILMRGKVTAVLNGKKTKLKKGMWVDEKTSVSTEKKSFVKLLFIDKSSMNLGPKSNIVIDAFPKKKAGIITLLKGQIRSKVTKNYMEMQDKDKSKLFIKTPTAAMGIRGTDFQVNYNPANKNTSLITFSGAVAMAQLPDSYSRSPASSTRAHKTLEKFVSSPSAVMVKKGQISGVMPGRTKAPMKPVKMHPGQHEAMKHNDGSKVQVKKPKVKKQVRSIVPKGMKGKDFANNSDEMDTQMKKVMGTKMHDQIMEKVEAIKIKEIEKYENITNNSDNPADSDAASSASGASFNGNGMMVDTETLTFITPDPDAVLDTNTGTLAINPKMGTYDPATGNWQATEYDLNDKGEFVPMKEDVTRLPASTDPQIAGNIQPDGSAPKDSNGVTLPTGEPQLAEGNDGVQPEGENSPNIGSEGPLPPVIGFDPNEVTDQIAYIDPYYSGSGGTAGSGATGELLTELAAEVLTQNQNTLNDTGAVSSSNETKTRVTIQVTAP